MSLDKALEFVRKVQDELTEVNPEYAADAEAIAQDLEDEIIHSIDLRDEAIGEVERRRMRQQGVG